MVVYAYTFRIGRKIYPVRLFHLWMYKTMRRIGWTDSENFFQPTVCLGSSLGAYLSSMERHKVRFPVNWISSRYIVNVFEKYAYQKPPLNSRCHSFLQYLSEQNHSNVTYPHERRTKLRQLISKDLLRPSFSSAEALNSIFVCFQAFQKVQPSSMAFAASINDGLKSSEALPSTV